MLCPLLAFRGERYIGMWQEDQQHGPGIVVMQSGVCYQRTFHMDKMVVSLTIRFPGRDLEFRGWSGHGWNSAGALRLSCCRGLGVLCLRNSFVSLMAILTTSQEGRLESSQSCRWSREPKEKRVA